MLVFLAAAGPAVADSSLIAPLAPHWAWDLAIILAVGLLAGGCGFWLCHRGTERAAEAERPALLGRAAGALTDRNGVVLAVNAAMRRLAEGRSRPGMPVVDLLRPLLDTVDPGLIYRMSRAAIAEGLASEEVVCPALRRPMLLCLRSVSGGRLAWNIFDPEDLPRGLGGAALSALYGQLPVPHLRRIAGGDGFHANAAFREIFGDAAIATVETMAARSPVEGGRVLLPASDGSARLCRVFSLPSLAGAEPDYLVFPISGGPGGRPGTFRALEVVPVALMQLDLDGRVLWMNAQARSVLGREIEPGTALERMVEPLGRPIRVLIDEARSGPARSRGEMVRLRGEAWETFLQVSLTRVRLEDTDTLLAVLTDASDLRQLEDQFAQSQKMEAIGKLAGGVAHDFNNVLTAISGHCDLLMLGKDAIHPDYSDLTQIRQNSNRAAALVRQLLAFSRKQTLQPETLSLQDVVSDTLYLLDRLIGERVTLQCTHGRELWPVRADQQQVEQALLNLVVNARDAMPSGGLVTIATRNAVIEAETTRQGAVIPAGEYVEVSVTDSGPGIDPAVIGRIFEPFFTTKPKGEGTGLGLSTVYGIVKQSGGYVWAENISGGGCCFHILLPRAQASAHPAPAPVRATPRLDTTGNGVVLLVEDEDPVRTFASRALKLRGYDVLEAANAEEAMVVIRQPEILVDVLVSDVVMPGMDGPTFAAEARRLRPDLRLIFISGYAEDSFRRNLTEENFLFLAKPFSLNDLTAKVKEALTEPV